jgi:prepilin-type N-terminal cleavage/methylation domain-containing protein/prepilin-type processing-associated H-X9-DG protein
MANKSAFTLIELLVVLTIVSLLAALGAAGVSRALEQSRAAGCLANLRQIGVAALAYAADNNGQLPQSSHQGPSRAWTKTLKASLPSKCFRSPLDTGGRALSYAINDYLTEHPAGAETLDFSRVQSLPAPAHTFWMAVLHPHQLNSDHFHFAEAGHGPSAFSGEVWTELTDGGSHYLFADGHVERLSWTWVQQQLSDPASPFVRPDGNTE